MEELDLRELFRIVLRRWWIIVVSTVVCVAFAAVISFFVLKPIYQSNTTLYIYKKVESKGAIEYNELLVGNQLVKDYRELVKSRMVSEEVIQKLNLVEMTPEKLSSKVSVNLKNDTRVIEIATQDGDPTVAKTITAQVADVFMDKVVKIMQVDNVQIIDKANTPNKPVKPNKKMNVAIAIVLGMMLGIGIVFLIENFDNTIKTPEDVQKHINIPVIGTIPVFPE